jgi:DNA-binding transcriptional LysR family regulator
MNVVRFEHFLVLARVRHFGRAAELLGIGQPTLTRSIQKLEAELGGPLFERAGRRIQLSALGAALQPHAEQMTTALRQARGTARSVLDGDGQILSVGATFFALHDLLVPRLKRLVRGQGFPRVRVRVDMSDRLVNALLGGEVDIAMGPFGDHLPDTLEAERLTTAVLRVVVGSRHPLARQTSVSLQNLAEYEWILPSERVAGRQGLIDAFVRAGLGEPRVRIEMDQAGAAIFDLVAATDLLGVHAGNEPPQPGLVLLKTPALRMHRQMVMAWRRSWHQPKAAQHLIAALRPRS